MKLFNAIQLVIIFALLPFGLSWIWNAQPFSFQNALFGILSVLYVALLIWITGMVFWFFTKGLD